MRETETKRKCMLRDQYTADIRSDTMILKRGSERQMKRRKDEAREREKEGARARKSFIDP